MKFLKCVALLVALGLAAVGVHAAEWKMMTDSGYTRVDTAIIDSGTSITGLALKGQDRRLAFYASSTNSVGFDLWGARTDGARLTKLGAMTATSASTLASSSIATIFGYQKVIVSPTSALTGMEKLHLTGFQVK